ncbi:MAG: Na/Pi cotransporter family protein [Leptospira sp.]|nr:Na/Pi cotransporter family protein [Leptospira sp.]
MTFELFWENFDQWKFLAGLGIFLFGMFLIEESIRKLSGKAFRRFLQIATNGRIKSILSGAATTAILQSSFAVSLMALAFVGARVITMENAIGVVLGSNLGTTATTWIVATVGFKVNIESFALPMIGIGGLGTILLGKSEKYSNIAKLISGFGFLFMGLDYMKISVTDFTDKIDLALIPNYGNIIYLLIGALITAMMMSSSASLAIAMTTFHAGITDFTATCAFFIGANIGNVLPLILTSIGGTSIRKRVVAGHFFFNMITGVITFTFLPLVTVFVDLNSVDRGSQVQGLAIFHTIFNATGILLFAPFLNYFTAFLNKLFPEKKIVYAVYLNNTAPIYPEAGIPSLRKEVQRMLFIVFYHNSLIVLGQEKTKKIFSFFPSDFNIDQNLTHNEVYSYLKLLQVAVYSFSSKMQEHELSPQESDLIQKISHASQSLLYSAKYATYILEDWEEMNESDNKFIESEIESLQEYYTKVLQPILTHWQVDENLPVSQLYLEEGEARSDRQNKFTKRMSLAISKKSFPKSYFTTLLNTQRAIYQSYDHLFSALQNLFSVEQEIHSGN